MVGKTILHYRVLKEIGRGGMGIVYKAEDTKLHRTVAIKALSADLIGDDKARARFLREARAASAIDHPNICTVYEINEAEGSLFFVMQYIEGRTLKKLVTGRPLPIDQALEYMLEITDALADAHRRNIIHRDIKSSNIMLNERDQVKILDFGLAKVLKPPGIADSQASVELTQLGSPFGTASYMSPEQARGERADMRSDIFSLGIVFYEMLTGRLPFKGKTSVDVMHSVLHEEPAPIEGVSPQLQQIVSRTLAKDPGSRYQSAERVLEDLRALVRSYYADKGVPPDKAALRSAAKGTGKGYAGGGIFNRMTAWMQRTFVPPATPSKDESSAGSTPPSRDPTPSMWQSRDKKAVAILPFKNLSGSPENDFYGFSLADSVITELAQLHDLIVRPSSYIVQYQNKDIDPRTVGSQLAVDHVLIGGYLKSGDRFRLTPQLVDTVTGEIVWSEKIDVESKDIILIQDTISRQIVDGLRVKTSPKEEERLVKTPTENAEAYENYLKGRTLLYKFITQTLDVEDLDNSVEMFAKAVELDPNFGLAYSGLGVCELNYVLKGMGGLDYYAQAKAAFERALAINPKLMEPRVRMVYVDLIEGRTDTARHEIRHLLREAPNEPSVHSTAAYVYRLSGLYDRALAEWDRLLKISPTEVVFASYNRARIFIYQRDYAKAESELARGLAFEPHHPLLRFYGAVIQYYRGDIAGATQTVEDILATHPDLRSQKIFLAYCYIARGDREAAMALIDDRVVETARADQDTSYQLATAYALAHENDLALEWLERSIAMGNENYPWIAFSPNWGALQDDPQFTRIVDGLKEKWEKLAAAV